MITYLMLDNEVQFLIAKLKAVSLLQHSRAAQALALASFP